MNIPLLKIFGQKARTFLIDGVTRKLYYWGFDKDGNITEQPEPLTGGYTFREGVFDDPTVPRLWQSLNEAISKDGVQEVAERAAYIWFNRLMALQILGKNGYEESLLVPLSVEEQTPLMVKRARTGQYDFLNKIESERLRKILTDYERETQVFAILLIGFCHRNSLLRRVFGSIDDYTELLLPDDILSAGGFLDLLNNGDYIAEDDYKKVELIGWLYQFYISEKKDLVFKKFKDGGKAEAKDIPAATQIFTPNWIVKYMVENTVGKIWLEKHPDSPIKESLQYLVEAADDNETPEPIIAEAKDLKLLDPAVGSGHILVEGFDLLFRMYSEEFYSPEDAVESILQNNLFGLDIDMRAAQLAQFAILMKAAQYHLDILKKDIVPHIYAMPEPVHFTKEDVKFFLGDDGAAYLKQLHDALYLMLQAQNLGSIMKFDISEDARAYILKQFAKWQQRKDLDLLQQELLTKLTPYLHVLELLTQQYVAIAANPPYMGRLNMNGYLKNYIELNYPASKSDLMTVFMEKSLQHIFRNGRLGMINIPTWLSTGSFKELRELLIKKYTIDSLIHNGRGIFGPDFGSVSFIIKKANYIGDKGVYRKLFVQHVNVEPNFIKEERFLDKTFGLFRFSQAEFLKIPGYPFAYWLTETFVKLFEEVTNIDSVGFPKQGLATTDNETFLRIWNEVDKNKIHFYFSGDGATEKKWFPFNKGGEFRRWYGNVIYLINWENNGKELKSYPTSVIRNQQFYFKTGLTWSDVGSGKFSMRYSDYGAIFDSAGPTLFLREKKDENFILGLLNTKVAQEIFNVITPTIHYNNGVVGNFPIKYPNNNELIKKISDLVDYQLSVSKADWNSYETAWEFQYNYLIQLQQINLSESYSRWLNKITDIFLKFHSNEVELNRIFIEIYGLEEELTPEVPLKDTTIFQEELDYEKLEEFQEPFTSHLLPIKKDVPIRQLISYAIGCYMGRYRLDKPGLQIGYSNPAPQELETYDYTSPVTGERSRISIDDDGIIPLMGNRSNFADDAYNKLKDFLVTVWGVNTLTSNINFIQDCLNQELEDYLVKKFWNYHVRTYSKKPIYWLFSSTKGAFQTLVYMHRMNRFTVEKVRDKYLLKHIQFIEQEIARVELNMAGLNKTDQKKVDTLRKDLQECNEYDLLLKDVATKQIEFDLDDGVTRNYELFKSVVAPIK